MNVRHFEWLHSFSIKNIFDDKMDLRLCYFHVTICRCEKQRSNKTRPYPYHSKVSGKVSDNAFSKIAMN